MRGPRKQPVQQRRFAGLARPLQKSRLARGKVDVQRADILFHFGIHSEIVEPIRNILRIGSVNNGCGGSSRMSFPIETSAVPGCRESARPSSDVPLSVGRHRRLRYSRRRARFSSGRGAAAECAARPLRPAVSLRQAVLRPPGARLSAVFVRRGTRTAVAAVHEDSDRRRPAGAQPAAALHAERADGRRDAPRRRRGCSQPLRLYSGDGARPVRPAPAPVRSRPEIVVALPHARPRRRRADAPEHRHRRHPGRPDRRGVYVCDQPVRAVRQRRVSGVAGVAAVSGELGGSPPPDLRHPQGPAAAGGRHAPRP